MVGFPYNFCAVDKGSPSFSPLKLRSEAVRLTAAGDVCVRELTSFADALLVVIPDPAMATSTNDVSSTE